MAKYHGKSVLVTGGTTGMGLATAKLLVSEGARVMITGRTSSTVILQPASKGRGLSASPAMLHH